MKSSSDRDMTTSSPPQLEELQETAWRELEAALADGTHGWHLAAIATTSTSGAPELRTVVLRLVDQSERIVGFHTDRRASKIAQLQRDPRVGVLFYDRTRQIQLRATGDAHVHLEDEIAERAWEGSSFSSRRCYLAPHAPSSDLETFSPNLPPDLLHRAPEEAASEAGRDNFALVRIRLDTLEWLQLRHDGHVRARYTWTDDGECTAGWVAP